MALPFLAAVPGIAKGAYGAIKGMSIGKMLIAAYMASMGLDAAGRVGKYSLGKQQMNIQALMGKASAEASKMSVKESRARSKEYMEQLLKVKREDKKEARELRTMQAYQQSQDRQMAMILQTMQSIGQQRSAARPSGGGMLGLIRGEM